MANLENQDFNFQLPLGDKKRGKKWWYQRWWGILFLLILLIFLSLVFAFGFFVLSLINSGGLNQGELNFNQSKIDESLLISKDSPALGPKDAKITLVEFGDFQCPACQKEHPVVKEILRQYQGKIRFVFRHFPLIEVHPQALAAALAAACAQEQGSFWLIYEKLFENSQNLTPAEFKKYAEQLGLDLVKFDNCLESQKYLERIEQDLADGIKLGVAATPTFFINGIMVKGAIPLERWEKIIEGEISR